MDKPTKEIAIRAFWRRCPSLDALEHEDVEALVKALDAAHAVLTDFGIPMYVEGTEGRTALSLAARIADLAERSGWQGMRLDDTELRRVGLLAEGRQRAERSGK